MATENDETNAAGGFFRRTFLSFADRNFRIFFWGQLLSNTGNWLTMVALTLLILKLTNSGLAVGLLTACQFGPILLLSAWAGVIADRSDKRKLLFLTQSLEMVQSFVLGALAFMGHPPIVGLYATALAGGILLAFDNPVRRSFVVETVPLEHVPNAVTLYSAMVNASRIFGPALAGALVVTLGFGWCFTIDAFSYLAVLVALIMIRTSELRRVPATPRGRGQVRAGLRYVRRVPALWITFVMLTIIGTLTYNFSVLFPLFVVHGLHGSDATYTFVYSVFSVGSLVGALAVAHRSSVRVRFIVVGAAAFGLSMLLLAFAPTVAWVFPLVFLVGLTSIRYMTATTAIVQVRADPQMQGRVIALQSVLLIGTTPIGGPFLGAVADAFGARVPLVIGALAAVAAAAWGAFAERRARDPSTPLSRTADAEAGAEAAGTDLAI
jgi:MFS family permease